MSVPLQCEGVHVRFGAFHALKDVSLSFLDGRIYGLIGPNGAGKTTLINVISGALKPSSGEIRIGGERVADFRRHAFARRGVSRSFQTSSLFPNFSVLACLVLALQARLPHQSPWRDPMRERRLLDEGHRMLATLDIERYAHERVENLSHGNQRLLELGMAFIGDSNTVLLDEPFAGVGHSALEGAVLVVARLARGRTTIIVEHNISALMRLADEVVVLMAGSVIAQGNPEAIRSDPGVRRAYLGSQA